MPVKQVPLNDRQKRDEFADLAEACMATAAGVKGVKTDLIRWQIEQLNTRAQVYATLALAYKD